MQPDITKLTLIELQAYAYQNLTQIEALQNGVRQLQEEIAKRPIETLQAPVTPVEKKK